MLPSDSRLKYVLGEGAGFSFRPLSPFNLKVREFLGQLSASIIADAAAKSMPDVISFAWWCRKSNIERLAAAYEDGVLRIGRGLAFHITPANMPVNFAFSWVFSLLAGNANVVRLPTRDFAQIPFILRHVDCVLRRGAFAELGAMNAFVTYEREEDITKAFSAIADVRIVWGGDATISSIRKAPLPSRSVDVGFADRYSFCMLGASKLLELETAGLERLALNFYNDAYNMDQNACSSPRLIVWHGTAVEVEQAGERFWDAVRAVVEQRYELSAVAGVDKLVQACRDAVELDSLSGLKHTDNRIYRLRLNAVDSGIENRRCGSGYFYEYRMINLNEIASIVTSKYQTLTYFGLPKDELAAFVKENRLPGIDRIVPVGKAMDIGILWDGYDLIRTFSRVCDVQ
jgi:hypothetical protein